MKYRKEKHANRVEPLSTSKNQMMDPQIVRKSFSQLWKDSERRKRGLPARDPQSSRVKFDTHKKRLVLHPDKVA